MARAKKSMNFEQAFAELEDIVEQMESGELELEESLAAFEKGIKLTRDCQQALTSAEQKVQLLLDKHGQLLAQDVDLAEEITQGEDEGQDN